MLTKKYKVLVNFRLEGEDQFSETYSLIACDENNEERGILSFTIDKVERKSVIEVFRVEEPHRNKGIGTLLLESYANLGYSYTYPSQICFRSNNNLKVVRLFNKFGFSTVPYTDPHCPDFIKMVKNQTFFFHQKQFFF